MACDRWSFIGERLIFEEATRGCDTLGGGGLSKVELWSLLLIKKPSRCLQACIMDSWPYWSGRSLGEGGRDIGLGQSSGGCFLGGCRTTLNGSESLLAGGIDDSRLGSWNLARAAWSGLGDRR